MPNQQCQSTEGSLLQEGEFFSGEEDWELESAM